MAAEVDSVAPVTGAMDDIDLVPLSALAPLSPASLCSLSSASASSISAPTSPVDSEGLSACPTASHDADLSMTDCVRTSSGEIMQSLRRVKQQQQHHTSGDGVPDDDDIEPLLTHIGEGSMLHPLTHASFGSQLSFSHFVHFINKPDPSVPAAVDLTGEEPSSDAYIPAQSSIPPASCALNPLPLSLPSSASASPLLVCPPSLVKASAPSAVVGAGSMGTFTLESNTIAVLPIVVSTSIQDEYELQQSRRLRDKQKLKPTSLQPASTQQPAATQPVATSTASASSTTHALLDTSISPPPIPKPRRRPRSTPSNSSSSTSKGRGRKRARPQTKSSLVITFKRVRAPQPQPTQPAPSAPTTAPVNSATTSRLSRSELRDETRVNGAAAEKAVVDDREARKTRQVYESMIAREAREKEKEKEKKMRMEWRVMEHEPPPTAVPAKAADTADDILSAAERHDERLGRIPAAPLLTPTAAEFSHPMRYIRDVVNRYRQYGVACIRPPEGWRPAYEYTLDKEGIGFPCKRQVVKRYYGQAKDEKTVKEESKEEEAEEALAKAAESHLDAIALQVSAFSHQERLTMAEFRREEAQRRLEWEQMRTKWQKRIGVRQQQQQSQAQAAATSQVEPVMAHLVNDTPFACNSSPPPSTAHIAGTPADIAAPKSNDCPTMDEDKGEHVHTADVSDLLTSPPATMTVPQTAVAQTAVVATQPDVTNDDNGTAAVAVPIAVATPVLASLLPPPTLPPPPPAASTHAQVESEYWRWAMLYGKHKPTVYYANDVDTHPDQRTLLPPLPTTSPLLTSPPSPFHPWDLSALNSLPSSFLHHLNRSIPGITAPMLYIGMLHSTFCWHHEDHHLYSISYNHAGSLPKTWYGVPGSHCRAVEELANQHLYPFLDSTRSHLLARKTSMFTPVLLHEAGIPVYRAVQEEGMFVITFPRAYHSGFSHGFSLAESVNFALDDWLPDGGEATRMYRQLGQFPVVPFTELVVRAVETAVQESGSVEYDDDVRVEGLARLERTFSELVLDELKEREQLYGSGRHLRLSFAQLRCPLATRYCKSCLHATYLSHVRCDCQVGGGLCLGGHGLCRVHREDSEVVLAHSSMELITLLSDLQTTMFKVKQQMREKRADNERMDGSETLSDEEKAAVKLRNERFDECVALATSLHERECNARDMHFLLADQHEQEDDRPRRRMSGSGTAAGGGTRRRRKKRESDAQTDEPSTDTTAPPAAVDVISMVDDGELTVGSGDDVKRAAERNEQRGGEGGSSSKADQPAEKTADCAPAAAQQKQLDVSPSTVPSASNESAAPVSETATM